LTAYLFQPREAEVERHAKRRGGRRTRVQPSQQDRRRRRPRKAPGERYTTGTYNQAIGYGIAGVNRAIGKPGGDEIPSWHANQLRHNAATRLRRTFDLDTARAVLGHSTPVVTEVYAERDGTGLPPNLRSTSNESSHRRTLESKYY
jgi:integrase